VNEPRFREAERRMWASVGTTPTEQRVRLDRVGVEVRVQEVGEGPAVLFVHGASNSGVSWAHLVARLDGFRCVLLDRPGCGLSDPLPESFRADDLLAAFADTLVIDLLDGLGLESAPVVATSFGGYVALRSAAAHPDRVNRVMEFGWTLGAPSARFPWLMRMTSIPGVGRLAGVIPPNERAVRAMFRRVGLRQALDGGRIPQEMIDSYLSLLRDTPTMRNEIRSSAMLVARDGHIDRRTLLPASVLAAVRAPVYFLWGDEDPFGDPDTAQQFVGQLPNGELELMPGAGHAVWVDDPERAAATASRFLRDGALS
jgi:2-hydroxy-6-oxonona-2,4-dienedioate hydrolase